MILKIQNFIWRPLSQSELIPIMFNMELTRLSELTNINIIGVNSLSLGGHQLNLDIQFY